MQRQLDEYLSKGWVYLSLSLYGTPILFCVQKGWGLPYIYRLPGIKQIYEIGPLYITLDQKFTQKTSLCILF